MASDTASLIGDIVCSPHAEPEIVGYGLISRLISRLAVSKSRLSCFRGAVWNVSFHGAVHA